MRDNRDPRDNRGPGRSRDPPVRTDRQPDRGNDRGGRGPDHGGMDSDRIQRDNKPVRKESSSGNWGDDGKPDRGKHDQRTGNKTQISPVPREGLSTRKRRATTDGLPSQSTVMTGVTVTESYSWDDLNRDTSESRRKREGREPRAASGNPSEDLTSPPPSALPPLWAKRPRLEAGPAALEWKITRCALMIRLRTLFLSQTNTR